MNNHYPPLNHAVTRFLVKAGFVMHFYFDPFCSFISYICILNLNNPNPINKIDLTIPDI